MWLEHPIVDYLDTYITETPGYIKKIGTLSLVEYVKLQFSISLSGT